VVTRASSRAGFTLVGVVVAMAIIVILVAAVGPSISKIIERDREAELIFRGKQYGRAIVAFQKRYGRLPNKLDELIKMKPHTVRRLWKDPMCNCDDWETIIAGSPEAAPMGSAPPPGGGGLGTQTPGTRRSPSFFDTPTSDTTPPPSSGGGTAARTPTPDSIFGPAAGQKIGPIVGVRTKVRRLALKPWRGRDYTDEWRFLAGDADNDKGGPIIDPNSLYPNRTPSPAVP
jgi:type II secretory pathway pseudopilin PulG